MGNEMVVTEREAAVTGSDNTAELSVAEVTAQVRKIQEVTKAVMEEDVHYGKLPGTDKPTLLKPGAEKLSLTFRLAPSYEVIERDLGGGHREYRITCTLVHIVQGTTWGQGVGVCTTLESKYRYRDAYEPTGKPVPKEYWDRRNQSLIGGPGFRAKKIDGAWQIVKVTERQENPDLADTYNTILKMAKKRAHVDAVLTATAASDLFTQDLEEEDDGHGKPSSPKKQEGDNGHEEDDRHGASAHPNGNTITPQQRDVLKARMNENGWLLEDGLTGQPEALNFLGSLGYEFVEQIAQKDFAGVMQFFGKKRAVKK